MPRVDVKLWLDDVRPPPDDTWTWATTAEQARGILLRSNVVEASLDHDLGYDGPRPTPCAVCTGSGWTVGDGSPCEGCEGHGWENYQAFGAWGGHEDNGYELVKWMCREHLLPEVITIHSWNPDGADNMRVQLIRSGASPTLLPYTIP